MKEIEIDNTQSINDVLNDNGNDNICLILQGGIYKQKVKITGTNIVLKAKDGEKVLICWADFNYKLHADGLLYNTFRTATLTITGTNVTLKNISVENTSGKGNLIGQALALALYGDKNLFVNCRFKSHQDTVFIGPLPKELTVRYAHILPVDECQTTSGKHKFFRCIIEGDVDYIFGSGNALFEKCKIISTAKGYIAAPSHYDEKQLGFIFDRCKIINLTKDEVYLARPWRDYGKVIFLNCKFSGIFAKNRYDDWDKKHFYFYEQPCIKNGLSKPLDKSEIIEVKNIIDSW